MKKVKKRNKIRLTDRLSEGMLMLIGLHLTLLIILLWISVCKAIPFLDDIFFGKTCIFTVFHIYCPGCGGTRAVLSLLRFHVWESFLYNPFVPVAVFVTLYVDVRTVIREIKGRKRPEKLPKTPYFNRYLLILLISSVILNFILRNVLLIFWGIDPIGDIGPYWLGHT